MRYIRYITYTCVFTYAKKKRKRKTEGFGSPKKL